MNVKRVATELRDIANERLPDNLNNEFEESGGKTHMIYMCSKIMVGDVEGEKAHRWIGWIQGCLYMNGAASLEEMKLVNKGA